MILQKELERLLPNKMGFFKYLKNKFSKNEDSLVKKVKSEKIVKIDPSKQKEDVVFGKKEVDKYSSKLQKPKNSFVNKLENVFLNSKVVDENLLENIKMILLSSDVGYYMSEKIIDQMRQEIKRMQLTNPKYIKELLADKMFLTYSSDSFLDSSLNLIKDKANVVLISGVNGSGKTTTIAKLASLVQKQGFQITLVAADTFRSGAVEQLEKWSKKLNAHFYGPKKEGQDPASVVFEALDQKQDLANHVFLIDTAGRLQNKINLMNELAKIKRIISEKLAFKNIINILVLDALIGQNSLLQAKEFNEILNIDGIVLTKMDSTSKGGIIFNIKEQLNIPIKYLGTGEKIDDLEEFDLEAFIYNLFERFIHE